MGMPCIRHPLLYCVLYFEQENAMLNAGLEAKKKYLAECLAENNISGAITMYEKPHRFDALWRYRNKITDDALFWKLFGDLWTGSENIWQNQRTIKKLLGLGRPQHEEMMSAKERATLAKLPEQVAIYRGHQGVNKHGWSWTLDEGKAWWFARRYGERGWVRRRVIPRDKITAYFDQEQEIVSFGRLLKLPAGARTNPRPESRLHRLARRTG